MKALVAQLQANQGQGGGGGGSNADADKMIADLQAKLAEKQTDLANTVGESRCCVAHVRVRLCHDGVVNDRFPTNCISVHSSVLGLRGMGCGWLLETVVIVVLDSFSLSVMARLRRCEPR
jgi:hypothetical protein